MKGENIMVDNENTKKEKAKVSLVAFLILLILFLVLLIASIIGFGKVYREIINPPTAETYKVQFDVNIEEAEIASLRVDEGGLVSKPKDPSKTGYHFDGWYRDEACENEWNFNTDKITSDITLYPKWTIITYTITFDLNGHGARIDSQSVEYNGLISKPVASTEKGYTFAGWYKEASCENAWNFVSDKVTTSTTLFAKWNIDSYNVIFDLNGHGVAISPLTVTFDSLATAPNAPTADGYVFAGWYKDAALEYKWNFSSDKVKESTTLYAKWIATYTVTFDMCQDYYYNRYYDSLSVDAIESQNVVYCGLVAEPTDPEDENNNYVFMGWYRDAGHTIEWDLANDVVTKNTTLYAKWAPRRCYVTFDINGIDEEHCPAEQEVIYGNHATNPQYVQPELNLSTFPYEFLGWFVDPDCNIEWDFDTDVVTDWITLYAGWIEVK